MPPPSAAAENDNFVERRRLLEGLTDTQRENLFAGQDANQPSLDPNRPTEADMRERHLNALRNQQRRLRLDNERRVGVSESRLLNRMSSAEPRDPRTMTIDEREQRIDELKSAQIQDLTNPNPDVSSHQLRLRMQIRDRELAKLRSQLEQGDGAPRPIQGEFASTNPFRNRRNIPVDPNATDADAHLQNFTRRSIPGPAIPDEEEGRQWDDDEGDDIVSRPRTSARELNRVDSNVRVPGGRAPKPPGARPAGGSFDEREPDEELPAGDEESLLESSRRPPTTSRVRMTNGYPAYDKPSTRWQARQTLPPKRRTLVGSKTMSGSQVNPDVAEDVAEAEKAALTAGEGAAEVALGPEDVAEVVGDQLLTQFGMDIGEEALKSGLNKVKKDIERWKPVRRTLRAFNTTLDDVTGEALKADKWLEQVPVLGKVVDAAGNVIGNTVHIAEKAIGGVNTAIDDAAKYTTKVFEGGLLPQNAPRPSPIIGLDKMTPRDQLMMILAGEGEPVTPNMSTHDLLILSETGKLPAHPTPRRPKLITVRDINGKVIFTGTQQQVDALRAKNKIQHERFQNMLDQVAAAAAARQEAAAAAAAARQEAAAAQGQAINRAAAIAQFRRAGAPTQASATQAYNDAIAKLGKASGKYKKAGSKKVKEDKKVVSGKKSKSKKCTSDVKASKRK